MVGNAGDVNGDGLADVIVGTTGAFDQSYLVFGKADGATVELAEVTQGIGGFALNGIGDSFTGAGRAVSGAGDVDGDGFDDLVIGAPFAEPNGMASGQSYVVFGGNFTGAVDGLGDDGDDIFIGSRAGEILVGGRGDDTLIGSGGADILNGAAGDDLLAIGDLSFRQLLGGSGADTVRMDTAGASLDLTATPDSFVQGIEAFDLNGNGNALVLDRLEILNIADDSNALILFGDDSNAVSGEMPGATVGAATVDGVDFQTFTLGQAELFVQTGVDVGSIETAVA